MKVKELTRKLGNFGTNPEVWIQKGGSILKGGNPNEIEKEFGDRKVETFIAVNKGQIKIFIS